MSAKCHIASDYTTEEMIIIEQIYSSSLAYICLVSEDPFTKNEWNKNPTIFESHQQYPVLGSSDAFTLIDSADLAKI